MLTTSILKRVSIGAFSLLVLWALSKTFWQARQNGGTDHANETKLVQAQQEIATLLGDNARLLAGAQELTRQLESLHVVPQVSSSTLNRYFYTQVPSKPSSPSRGSPSTTSATSPSTTTTRPSSTTTTTSCQKVPNTQVCQPGL